MENVEQLFRYYYSKMLLIAKMMLGDEDEARDCVSDVFAQMLNGKLKVLPGCAEENFVAMVHNRCLNLLPKKTTQDKVSDNVPLVDMLDTQAKYYGMRVEYHTYKLNYCAFFMSGMAVINFLGYWMS